LLTRRSHLRARHNGTGLVAHDTCHDSFACLSSKRAHSRSERRENGKQGEKNLS
jgi:hypothetical protein